jgi:hypothetical protein
MSDLVQRLKKPQDIELAIRPEATSVTLRSALERGFVFVRFPNTRGGTELGVKVDPTTSLWKNVDFPSASGDVLITGTLTLDYIKVRFQGNIDISMMKGTGYLEPIADSSEYGKSALMSNEPSNM